MLAFGVLDPARKIAERLLVNMRFIKPLDEDLALAARHRALVTIEENVTLGGAGTAVAQLLAAEAQPLPLLQIGIPHPFIEHGSRESCLAAAGLYLAGLSTRIEHWRASQCERDASAWRVELRSYDQHA
jgi:1-deoxy-D-xylulose-5-phosphate synthase